MYPSQPASQLERYFDGVKSGPGIWKWRHYFEVYERHLQQFVGRSPVVVEIGIYSGGSLPMWREYFGAGAVIHGVDIEESCRAYATDGIHVHIGDQSDPAFWRRFKEQVPHVDVLIDDGGHLPEQQSVSLEEMLPWLAPGGIYICEDIHGTQQAFADMVYGVCSMLNNSEKLVGNEADPERRLHIPSNPAQASVDGIHLYPFMAVVQMLSTPRFELTAPKHGTEWEPFLN